MYTKIVFNDYINSNICIDVIKNYVHKSGTVDSLQCLKDITTCCGLLSDK